MLFTVQIAVKMKINKVFKGQREYSCMHDSSKVSGIKIIKERNKKEKERGTE
jgi:hypothetical protein